MSIDKIDKLLTVIIIIVVSVGITGYIIYDGINKTMKDAGLSNVSKYKKYKAMIEFNVENGPDFSIVVNKNNKILNTLVFNDKAVPISKINIDNKNYKKSIDVILDELYKTNNISNKIVVTSYDNYELTNTVVKSMENYFHKYSLDVNIETKESTLAAKAKTSKSSVKSNQKILILLSLSSSEIINNHKQEKVDNDSIKYKKYSKEVYKKLEKYKTINNISNQEISDKRLNISDIPSSDNIYPDSDSWYYINNNKIFAYIKYTFKEEKFDFCYNGSIKELREGVCDYEK